MTESARRRRDYGPTKDHNDDVNAWLIVVFVVVEVGGASTCRLGFGAEHESRRVRARQGAARDADGEDGFWNGVKEFWIHDSE